MGSFSKFQDSLDKVMGPIARFMGANKIILALKAGFIGAMPITLGTAAIAILANLPFEFWQNFLTTYGLKAVALDFISLTLSLLGVYVVVSISYNYTKNEGENGMIGAMLSSATFMALMPIQKSEINGTIQSSLLTSNMGSNGIFMAMIVALVIPTAFCFLMKKNLKLKLPEAVPPMVANSLSPTFVAIIIFSFVFLVKWGLTFTSYGDLFTLIQQVIAKPILNFGASPWALMILYTFTNLCWFFGIHPSPITNTYLPVFLATVTANTEAFIAGEPLPYLAFSVVAVAVFVGGTGNTLGLCAATFFAKSDKYKSMRKLIIPANIFNINEPVIFGFPVMLNPIYFIPMVFSSLASGIVALLLVNVLPFNVNPTIFLPWVTPGFVSSFLSGGVLLFLVWLISFAIHTVLYLPFFLVDDKNTYLEEQQQLKAEQA